MLVYLQNIYSGKTFYLLEKQTFSLGRKNNDILIENDQSISKNHAEITIRDNSVYLKDQGSKYKTHHNKVEVNPQEEVVLKNNDEIKFGVFKSEFCIKILHYVVCCSALKDNEKSNLKNNLNKLGLQYSDNWTPKCTHLTVSSINLTIKFLIALIEEKPIVLLEYWDKFVESVANKIKPPRIEDYNKPPTSEPLLKNISISTNHLRKTLFKDKMFLFQKEGIRKQMDAVIKKSGGNCVSYENNLETFNNLIQSSQEIIVIQTEKNATFTDAIKPYLDRGNRTIPLQEIAYAVISCCIEKHCNPRFQLVQKVFSKSGPRMPTQVALAKETATESSSLMVDTDSSQKYIPATLDPQLNRIAQLENEMEIELFNLKEKLPRNVKDEDNIVGETKKVPEKKKNIEEIEERPAKKQKLFDKTSERSNPFKQIAKTTTTQSTINLLTPSVKRPAEESVDTTIVSKNPFAALAKKAKLSTEHSANQNNPFLNFKQEKQTKSVPVKKENDENVNTVTKPREPTVNIRQIENDDNESSSSSNSIVNLDDTWYSKKNPTLRIHEDNQELSDEIKNYIEKFKNVALISPLNVTRRTIINKSISVNNDSTFNTSCKNFKKFKKVQPLHPQRIILKPDKAI